MGDERSIESEFGEAAVAVAEASPNGTADHGSPAEASGETSAGPTADATGEHATATANTGATESASPEAEPAAATDEPGAADAPDFLTQLTRAMQATAGLERARAAEEIDRRSTTHIAAIRARAESEAAKMRDLAGDDRRAIERWAETEQQRIKAERDRRTKELEADLTQSLAEHGRQTDVQIQAVEAVVAKHRTDVDGFFASLDVETDPVRFAQRANQRPAFPDLDRLAMAATSGPAPSADTASATDAATDPASEDGAAPEPVGVMDPVAKLGLLEHSPEPSPFAKPITAAAPAASPAEAAGPSIVSPMAERTSGRPEDPKSEVAAQPAHGGPMAWLRRKDEGDK